MKRKAIYERIGGVIEADKSPIDERCERLFSRDLARVLAEYFDLDGEPSVKIERLENKFSVEIAFLADRVKNFYPLK